MFATNLLRKSIGPLVIQSTYGIEFFVVFRNEEEDICGCNRLRQNHERTQDTNDERWTMLRHTYEELNPAHGTLLNGALVGEKLG